MKKIILILFIICSILSCSTDSSNSDDNKNTETWSYVFSDKDIAGHWETKTNSNKTYSVDISSIVVTIYINDSVQKIVTGQNAPLGWAKTCKTNQNKTKLIIPEFGSNIILTRQ